MLNRTAKFLLVLTTLAPVCIVYGISLLGEDVVRAVVALTVAALLTAICILFLAYLQKHGERRELLITRSKNADRDVLAFLITYLLPLISRGHGQRDTLTLAAVVILVGIILYRSEMLHVNPLLGLLGYHFREVIAASGNTYLLLTRNNDEYDAQPVATIRITTNLWMEVPKV